MAKVRLRKQKTDSEFAKRLRTLRAQRNLSQKELAALAGMTVVHYGRYERGLSRPAADTLKRLANALGVSGDYLLDGAAKEAARANFEDLELLQLFQEVQNFPDEEKTIVKKTLEAFVVKRKLQTLAAAG